MPYYGEIYGGIDPNEVEGFQVGLVNTPHRIDVYLDAFKDHDITDKVVCDLGAGGPRFKSSYPDHTLNL